MQVPLDKVPGGHSEVGKEWRQRAGCGNVLTRMPRITRAGSVRIGPGTHHHQAGPLEAGGVGACSFLPPRPAIRLRSQRGRV